MVCEPTMNIFLQSLNIKAMINLCCNFETVADILKKHNPEIISIGLYDEFDFEQIYGNIIDTRLVRSITNHFKPKTIKLSSTLTKKLPVDLLAAFTLHSPKKFIIKLRGYGQDFFAQRLKMEGIQIENPYSESSSFATNAILQSSKKLGKIEIIHGSIDDITSSIIGCLCLESFILQNVCILCQEMDLLALNLTKQTFMTELRLRYFKNLNLRFLSFLVDNISSMNLITLELSFGNHTLNIQPITRMSSLKYVRFNIEKHSSNHFVQQLQDLMTVREDVKFEIYAYCACGAPILEEVSEYFQQFENVVLLFEQ